MKYTNTNHTKIRDLSDETINSFYYSCLNIPMNINFNGGVNQQFKDILNLLNSINNYPLENKMMLYHICLSIKKETKGFVVCLNSEIYKGNKASYKKTTNTLEALTQLGYGVLFRGDSERDGIVRYKSVFVLSDKLKKLFEGKNENHYPKEDTSNKEEVIVKGSNTRGISIVRKNVRCINNFLAGYDFLFNGQKIEPELSRVFGDTLKDYGRFYFSAQTIKSEYRKLFTIDGEVCTELDYSSNHARLCAELSGVPLDIGFKPYSIVKEGLVTSVPDNGDKRNIYKLGMMCLLNCKANHHTALANGWEDEYPEYGGVENSLEIIRELRDNNKDYLPEIKRQNAASLQYIDSCIMEAIMLSFVDKGVPFLPYHDSIVVPLSHQEEAGQVMNNAWRDILGSSDCCVVDIKF